MMTPEDAPLLLWDGECELCRRCVAWVVSRHKNELWIRPVPYQEAPSPPMNEALRARAERAVQLITSDGRRLEAGRAYIEVLALLGWRRTARMLGVPPLVWCVELGYWALARTRWLWGRVFAR